MVTPRRRTDPSPSRPPPLLSRLQSIASHLHTQLRKYASKEGGEGGARRDSSSSSLPKQGKFDPSTWRSFDSRALGIPRTALPSHVWTLMKILRQKGFEAYLVGGCVRDLLLKRAPKDFDVVTTADLAQVKNKIGRYCRIIGKRFPICQVYMRGSIIEVSSFSTMDKNAERRKEIDCSKKLRYCEVGDIVRWKDSVRRDFTINGLFFNPLNYTIYDYVNGLPDIRNSKVCTVIPARESFEEDCARILRGFRLVARLGFRFSKETGAAIRDLSSSIKDLGKVRLMMEMNFMLAYGAAEPSIRLLQKYGLLNILLPFHAAYLSDQTKDRSSNRDIMLMKLFANLDKLLAADRPCHCSLWLGLLAFHTALVKYPQEDLVVRAFAAVLYCGEWESAIKLLRQDNRAPAQFVPEILVSEKAKPDDLRGRTLKLASLVNSSVDTLTKLDALKESLARYSGTSQFSGLESISFTHVVFVSEREGTKLSKFFSRLDFDINSYDRRAGDVIDYKLLKDGYAEEVRFVLGKLIMDTMSDDLSSPGRPEIVVASRPTRDLNDESAGPLSKLFE